MGIGGRGNRPKDPRREVLKDFGVGRHNGGDRQIANTALAEILAALPEDIQQELAARKVTLTLPAVEVAEGKVRPFVLRGDQTLEQGVRDVLGKKATDEDVQAAMQYAADRVGSAEMAEAIGRAGGAIGATGYQTRLDNVLYTLDQAQKDPKLQAVIAEYAGIQPGAAAAAADAGWMAQRPGLLQKVPVLENATNGQLAIGGAGVGGAGAAFLLDYLFGGDDREAQPVAVVPSGGMR